MKIEHKTLSVLHLRSMKDDKYCGVWDGQKWIHKGSLDECYAYKTATQRREQEYDNQVYLKNLKAERESMFEAFAPLSITEQ